MVRRLKDMLARLKRTVPVRAFLRFGELRGNRLAGSVTFFGFVSLFPLLLIAVAIGLWVLGNEAIGEIQSLVDENLPSAGINIAGIRDNAGSLGIIGFVSLLFTGLGWVNATRAAVRLMWELPDKPGNPIVLKLIDLAALVGLGIILAVSVGVSTLVQTVAGEVLNWLSITSTLGAFASQAVGYVVAGLTSAVLFGYLLSGFPRIAVPRDVLIKAAVTGGVIFELLKNFLIGLVANTDSGARAAFATFAAPLALLAWVYLVTRLLMFLAAYTAEITQDRELAEAEEQAYLDDVRRARAAEVAAANEDERDELRVPGTDRLVLTPTVAQARAVGVASGAIMGGTTVGMIAVVRGGWRALTRAGRRRR